MRLREIDFLRGVAVLLVLFRHYPIIGILEKIGWAGVDLFFVISGFLVSGLLFNEHKKYNRIYTSRFLIRRGFKIYPLFYLMILTTIIFNLKFRLPIDGQGVLAEIFFVQNYFGHIWVHTWSLGVEEHFYIGVALLVTLAAKWNLLDSSRKVTAFCISIFVACLGMRIYNGFAKPFEIYTHLFRTHLRIDSLLFGVFLSYLYYFKKEMFTFYFTKFRNRLYILATLLILPIFIFDISQLFTYTIGFTFLYIGFGIILSNFVIDKKINSTLDHYLSKQLVNAVSYIGYCSYPIYLFHMQVHNYVLYFAHRYGIPENRITDFLIYFSMSILTGILVSKFIEKRVLHLRDKWFAKRKPRIHKEELALQPA
jgi:peptidoglycan/LPS O-acetylase OafA/YrhL